MTPTSIGTTDELRQQHRGVASQPAPARRVSPWAAQRRLGCTRILTAELPATFAEFRAGRALQWRAVDNGQGLRLTCNHATQAPA